MNGSLLRVGDLSGHFTDAQLSALFNPSRPSIKLAAERTSERIKLRQRKAAVAAILTRRANGAFLKPK